MEVTLLRWPTDWARREQLAQQCQPRLLLVEDGLAPPPTEDCLEDWIRVPAPETDVQLRLRSLGVRATQHQSPTDPQLDGDGVLRFASAWVPLPPVEARLTRAMLERFGAVVSRDALARAGWPNGAPGRNALDVHVLRLRRRLASVGLVIRTVRSRGYLLESGVDTESQASSR
ncbi:MAG: helix-turn-helix domain-containing protein [Acidimicrobiales bacterium]